MTLGRRLDVYRQQNGRGSLTGRQRRRLRHKINHQDRAQRVAAARSSGAVAQWKAGQRR